MKASEFARQSPDKVLNQPPLLENYNLFEQDIPLQEALRREGGGWIEEKAKKYGALLGKAETLKLGELANRHLPQLHSYDRFGHRIDEVEFHPAWHELLRMGIEYQTHILPWVEKKSGAHVARVALNILRNQIDEGTSCPLTMTFAVIPSLRLQPELAKIWEPRILSNQYDSRFIPASQKSGVLFGMAMTERQGGSDVRANTTRAIPLGSGGAGGEYEITGHKWFCSAPMCDAFLILAQTPKGLSCFLLPRWKPDDTRNNMQILRLKDKLGNKSNASSEVEFQKAWACMVGEEGRGVATIIEMVRHTRLDCVHGSTSAIRRAVAEATHHCNYRYAFGKRLIEQPLMKNVLADICLESEASTAIAMRLARAFDEASENDVQMKFARVATAISKYWVTKRAIAVVAESLECFGGNGFVEEAPMARFYLNAPLNSIWEGSGNVQCLDVLRSFQKEPETLEILFQELHQSQGGNTIYHKFLKELEQQFVNSDDLEIRARNVVESLALSLQASLLIAHAPQEVSDAFCASRLGDKHGFAFGNLSTRTKFDFIIERSLPKIERG